MASSKYTGEDIQVLEGLEPVRKRPGMYIGGVGSAGLHHLVWEIVDNSVDEAMNGHASEIVVTLHKDGQSVTVSDNGRGVPVDMHPKLKKPALEIVYTVLHAGGKFEQGNYKTSGNQVILTDSGDTNYSYCVSGDKLTVTPQSAQPTITGNIAFQQGQSGGAGQGNLRESSVIRARW